MHTQHVEQGHFFPRRWKAPVNCQRVSSLVKSCTNIHFMMKGPMLIIAQGEQRYIHATVNLDSRPIMLLWRKPRRLFLAHSPLQFGFLLSSLAAQIGWACSGTDIPVGLLLGFFFHWVSTDCVCCYALLLLLQKIGTCMRGVCPHQPLLWAWAVSPLLVATIRADMGWWWLVLGGVRQVAGCV
jgi:hypothetical protein